MGLAVGRVKAELLKVADIATDAAADVEDPRARAQMSGKAVDVFLQPKVEPALGKGGRASVIGCNRAGCFFQVGSPLRGAPFALTARIVLPKPTRGKQGIGKQLTSNRTILAITATVSYSP